MLTATKPDPPRLFQPSPACSPLPNFEFRVSNFAFLPLSPFPATLTRNQHFCRKTASVSPLFATLTDTPSRKSFPCHSCENMGGVPPLVPASTSRRPRNPLTPLESALTDSSSRTSFRIRSYEKHRGEGVHPASQISFPPAPALLGSFEGPPATISFLFTHFRTVLRNGVQPSLLFSAVSALFSSQRRGEAFASEVPHSPLATRHSPLPPMVLYFQ